MVGLVQYAKNEFALNGVAEDGSTVRAHLQQLKRQGRHIPELSVKPPPSIIKHVWHYWIDMSRMRPAGSFGPGTLGPDLIINWQTLRKIALLPIEIDMILLLEQAYRATSVR